MTTKIITAALAFFTTFGFSALMMQFAYEKPAVGTYYLNSQRRSVTGQKIYNLLRQDIKNGRDRDAKLFDLYFYETFSWTRYSIAVNEYVSKSSNLDDSDLPREIKMAWRAHMKAWRDYVNTLERTKHIFDTQDEKREWLKLESQKNDEITRTWETVLDVADDYNAVPRGAR